MFLEEFIKPAVAAAEIEESGVGFEVGDEEIKFRPRGMAGAGKGGGDGGVEGMRMFHWQNYTAWIVTVFGCLL